MVSVLATSLLIAPLAEATSYTVQKGDTLTKIAKAHNTTVQQIQKWNNLKGDTIYVAQKLVVANTTIGQTTSQKVTSQPVKTPPKSANSQQTVPSKTVPDQKVESTYKVDKGDTLTKIASKYNVTVADLKTWNQLTTDVIYIGQMIRIASSEQQIEGESNAQLTPEQIGKKQITDAEAIILDKLASEKTITTTPNKLGQATYTKAIEMAESLIGTPYVFGGNTPDGFDCSGFVQYIYSSAGAVVKRLDSESYFTTSSTLVKTPVPGDIVFLKTHTKQVFHIWAFI